MDAVAGVTAFVNVIATFTNQVQAGSAGTSGIFTFGNAAMISILLTQQPVSDNSWAPKFANAWQAGILAGTIAPRTVTNAKWLVSDVDTLTVASPAVTITNVSAAKAALEASLLSITATPDSPLPLATAIRNATLSFTFNCIGIGGTILTPVTIPLPFSAQ
jgi:hypothetical protein